MGNMHSEPVCTESEDPKNEVEHQHSVRDSEIKKLKAKLGFYEKRLRETSDLLKSKTQQMNKMKEYVQLSDNHNDQIIDAYLTIKKYNIFMLPDHVEKKVLIGFITYYNELLRNKYIHHGICMSYKTV